MAYLVKTPPLERILQYLNPDIASGSTGEKVYSLPIYLRRDGVVIKLGYLVRKTGVEILYTVREILVRSDLESVTLALSPVECGEGGVAKMKEELVLVNVEEVSPVKGRMMALELARDGMRKVARNIVLYPLHVQRVVRKHQLATQIRTSVQRFLAGFSLARSTSIGCVDWRLDPGLLGLERETDFSVEYRVERFAEGVTSHLDLLLGKGWDVRKVGGGFRVIMTLELVVDVNQQIRLDTHATLCQGELGANYRTRCMEAFANSVTPAPSFVLFSRDITLERIEKPDDTSEKFESLQSNRGAGVSLDWEEFQDSQDEATLEVSLDTDIETGINDATPSQDSPDCDTIEEEPSSAIKKLLDTPTKGFSQIVFNVSNKHSGDSNDSKAAETIDKVSDDLVNDIVSKIREVRLSEDSLDTSFEVDKQVAQDSVDLISPIKLAFQNKRSELKENSLDTSDELYSPSKQEQVFSDVEYRRPRHSTSTPDGDLDVNLHKENCIVDNIGTNSTSRKDLKFKKDDNQDLKNEIPENCQLSVNSIRTADDTFENISDLSYEKAAYTMVDHLNDSCIEVIQATSPTSSSEPLSTKDEMLTSPEEDICSEDYRVSSSNDAKLESTKGSPENDGVTVISVAKQSSVDQNLGQSTDKIVCSLVTPESMMSSPQSSVNKVAAYVQSLPSPQSGKALAETSEDYPEDIEDGNVTILDESLNEDEANNSLASSRSKASRQSDLSNLTGRFSNGVGGMFFGSALGASGTPGGQTVCPFPDDWQFNTIPESIENDEDID